MKWILAVLMVGMIAAAPATQPATTRAEAKPVEDLKALLASAPSDCTPKKGEKWQNIHVGMMIEWFKTIYGKRMGGAMKIRSTRVDYQWSYANVDPSDFVFRGIGLRSNIISLKFPKSDAVRLGKMKPGDRIVFDGTIEHMQIVGSLDDLQRMQLIADLVDCKLKR